MANRNMVFGIIVVAVLSVSLFAVVTIFRSSQTRLHYERNYTGEKLVSLIVAGLEDCVLTLGYEDNENLMYRIDIELYDASETVYFEYTSSGSFYSVEINGGSHFGHTTRARYMNITLGTGHAHLIVLGGGTSSSNVTGNIVFDNNATLGGEEFGYLFPGTLNLVFTEDVDFSQGGLDMSIGGSTYDIDSISMYIDLPAGMDGKASFRSDSMSISTTGWTLYQETVSPPVRYYQTAETPTKPLLDIDTVYGDHISAILLV
jgi:hypothetical protein